LQNKRTEYMEIKMDKGGAFFAGITIILTGIGIMFKPKYIEPVFGAPVDFSGYEIPFGLACIVIGVLCIWIAARPKQK